MKQPSWLVVGVLVAVTGSIPSLIGLTALQSSYVNNNQLTGSTPSLSGRTALVFLDVSGNRLTGR